MHDMPYEQRHIQKGAPMSDTQTTLSVPLQSASCCGDDCCGGQTATARREGTTDITEAVRARYGSIATDVLSGARSSCCDSGCCGTTSSDTISEGLYQVDELKGVPLKAALASL